MGLSNWGTVRRNSAPEGLSAAVVVGSIDWLGLKVSWAQSVVAGQGESAWVISAVVGEDVERGGERGFAAGGRVLEERGSRAVGGNRVARTARFVADRCVATLPFADCPSAERCELRRRVVGAEVRRSASQKRCSWLAEEAARSGIWPKPKRRLSWTGAAGTPQVSCSKPTSGAKCSIETSLTSRP